MNKTDLVAAVAEKTGLTKKDAERILNVALDTITDSLCEGEKVQLSGFGTFETKIRKARIGRDMNSHAPMDIPETRVPTFKASPVLKKTVAK